MSAQVSPDDVDRVIAGAVDIVIVNWNSGVQLRSCIASIVKWSGGIVRSIIVVDNGSTDGSADRIYTDEPETTAPAITVVEAGANLGFGRACNLGAARATAPFLLFLNPDAALQPNTLRVSLGHIIGPGGHRIGALGIRLIDDRGEVQRHTTDRPTVRAIYTHDQRATRFDHLSSRDVHHVIGAFYLIRTALFRELGGFDERFFMYLEDLDLSDRVIGAGWRVFYLAEAVGFHKGGGVSEQVKAKRLFFSMRSRLQYSLKHFPLHQAALVAAVTLTVEPILRLARAIARRSTAEIGETLTGYGLLYRSLPSIVRTHRAHRPPRRTR